VKDERIQKELRMETLRERKRKRIKNILLNSPFTLILVVINTILVSWILHILYVIFTDALDHMSLYEWTEHLYLLAKNTFEDIFASISIVV
jgi:hypothetical protein